VARYSSREGRWYGQRRSAAVLPETVRDERQWRTEMPGGITRIDFGAPVPRLPCEPQPVHVSGSLKAPAAAPKAAPAEPPASTPQSSRDGPSKPQRAITREP